MSLADGEETDLELVTRLMAGAVRESVFQSDRLHLEPEQILAGVLLAYHGIKDELPGHEVLERAHGLALEHIDTVRHDAHAGPVEHQTPYL